jgi:hypothetical protein
MKMLRFIFYVLKHGSLRRMPVNFQTIEEQHLSGIQTKKLKKNWYTKIKNKFTNSKSIGSLLGNFAYVKALSRQHRNFFFVDNLQMGYVRILKSASTSTLKELLPRIDTSLRDKVLTDRQIDLLAAYYASDKISHARLNYELFTIVRNPFQRLVSVYLDLFNSQNLHFGYQTFLFGIFKRDMSFHDFVKTIAVIPDNLKSGHLIQQINVVNTCGGREKIKCFRLEKDQKQLAAFLASKGIEISHRNKSISDYDYRSYYDANTANLTYRIYKSDVEAFEYEADYKMLLHHLKG